MTNVIMSSSIPSMSMRRWIWFLLCLVIIFCIVNNFIKSTKFLSTSYWNHIWWAPTSWLRLNIRRIPVWSVIALVRVRSRPHHMVLWIHDWVSNWNEMRIEDSNLECRSSWSVNASTEKGVAEVHPQTPLQCSGPHSKSGQSRQHRFRHEDVNQVYLGIAHVFVQAIVVGSHFFLVSLKNDAIVKIELRE